MGSIDMAIPDVRGGGVKERRSQKPRRTDLLAQPLDISFGELLALHQALNPAVEGWDGSGLDVGRGQLCGHAPDVLHVCVHSGNWAVGGFCRVGVVVKGRGTGEVLSGSNGSSAWSTAVAKNRSNDVCVHWHVRLWFQARRGAGPRLGQNWAGGQVVQAGSKQQGNGWVRRSPGGCSQLLLSLLCCFSSPLGSWFSGQVRSDRMSKIKT